MIHFLAQSLVNYEYTCQLLHNWFGSFRESARHISQFCCLVITHLDHLFLSSYLDDL